MAGNNHLVPERVCEEMRRNVIIGDMVHELRTEAIGMPRGHGAGMEVGAFRYGLARDWPHGRVALVVGDQLSYMTPNHARRLVTRLESAIREAEQR